jgi:hypothetical protein
MSREAGLFDEANGSPLRGYLLLKSRRGGNIPPNWIVRSRKSRKGREKDVATAFKKSKRARMTTLEDWELAYRKECFYRGIRALLDLEREGETRLWAKLSGSRNILLESRAPHTLLALAEAGQGIAVIPSVLRTDRYRLKVARVTHRRKPLRDRYVIQWKAAPHAELCPELLRGARSVYARRPADYAAVGKQYAKTYPIVAYPGVANVPPNYPTDIEKAMVTSDIEWISINRDRILAEWTKRYGGKSVPKKWCAVARHLERGEESRH